jgi:hypothetical protein
MEPNFFNSEKKIYSWKLETDSRRAHDNLKKNLKLGLPVFLQTDLLYLKYYHSKIHFPGHVIVCMGFDERRKIFFVSDTNFKEIQIVSFSDMDKARSSNAEPYPLSYNWFVVEQFKPFKNLNKKIEDSIFLNSQNYIKGQSSLRGTSSLFTLLEWIENLDKWINLQDSQSVFRFAYQVIAKRGSRGGGFRYIYEEFLKFAESESNKINKLKLSSQMHDIAQLWEESALVMKKISYKKNRKDLADLKKTLSDLYSLEYEYHSKVLDTLGGKKKGA